MNMLHIPDVPAPILGPEAKGFLIFSKNLT
jgi:hypothetical protein